MRVPAQPRRPHAPDFHGFVAAARRVLALQRGGGRQRAGLARAALLPLEQLALLLQGGQRLWVQQVALALKQLQARLIQHRARLRGRAGCRAAVRQAGEAACQAADARGVHGLVPRQAHPAKL